MHCYTQCPQPCSRPQLTHTSVKGSWTLTASLGQSLVGVTAPFSWVLCTQGFVCALQEPVSPVLCKLWRLYGGVNGDLLQEGLRHTQVCCTQGPGPCSSPLLTRTSAGDIQTQFCLGLCGVSGSWCTQGLFEPSEHLWRVWGLSLNMILSLLPSCWGFSFALGSRIYFFGGILHSPVNGCSAVSCNFGVLSGEDEHTCFCSPILEKRS